MTVNMQRHSEPKGEESICRNTIKTSFWGFCKNRRIYYTNLLWVNKTKQILRFAQYDARKGFIVFFCHLSKNNSQYCCSRQSENPLNMTNGYTSFWTHKVGYRHSEPTGEESLTITSDKILLPKNAGCVLTQRKTLRLIHKMVYLWMPKQAIIPKTFIFYDTKTPCNSSLCKFY